MYVKGVGPRLSVLLAAKGIQVAEDLLYHLPFRYEDRQNPRSLDELKAGETASVIAEVRGSLLMKTRKAPIFELTVGQGRLALKCIWFNGSYLEGKFHAGQTVAVYGKVEPSRSTSNFKMIQPHKSPTEMPGFLLSFLFSKCRRRPEIIKNQPFLPSHLIFLKNIF